MKPLSFNAYREGYRAGLRQDTFDPPLEGQRYELYERGYIKGYSEFTKLYHKAKEMVKNEQ